MGVLLPPTADDHRDFVGLLRYARGLTAELLATARAGDEVDRLTELGRDLSTAIHEAESGTPQDGLLGAPGTRSRADAALDDPALRAVGIERALWAAEELAGRLIEHDERGVAARVETARRLAVSARRQAGELRRRIA